MTNKTSKRKLEHIKACLDEDVEALHKTTGFKEIEIVHQAAPEIDLEEIDIKSTLFGKTLKGPIIISPMTGGHKRGEEINKTLAKAAQELNIAFSVGSQRAAIENPELEETYKVREVAPDILLFGNLGIMQLNQDYGTEEAEKAIEMIDADGLGIHFNSLQEAIQPEGHANFKGTLKGFSKITSELENPIYVKETGAGVSSALASEFVKAGAKAIDVSGAGGTSWAKVESMREESETKLGEVFRDWGIPTSVSTAEVSRNVDVPVISSGGIRTGLDAAKAIALGGDLIGLGLPLFQKSKEGKEKVIEWIEEFIKELKVAMFLSGCKNIDELKNTSLIITGKAQDWFVARGLNPEYYGG